MPELSDSIERKFTDVIDLSDWEIETPNGWSDISSIMQTIPYEKWRVEFADGLWIECADDHILILEDGSECFTKNLIIGDKVKSVNGSSIVTKCFSENTKETMYDVEVESESHHYYSNGLVSHNTTTAASYILWYTLFHDNKTTAILANKGFTAREILSRAKDMYELLPIWLQQGVKTWNKGDIELENGSKIFCAATTATGIRGKSCNMLLIDEASSIPNNIAEEFFASTYPVISSGKTTKVVVTSTPCGYNHFWRMWNGAINKTNEFVPFSVHWSRHPHRDQAWADEQRRVLGDVKYNQEIETEFLGSSLTLINSNTIAKFSISTPIKQDEHMKIYQAPVPSRNYILICDPSEGVGVDNSAATVIDITEIPYKIVAIYKNNKISPTILPNIIHRIATSYNNAHILCEINKAEQVSIILHDDLEYDNVLYVSRGKTGQEISAGFGGGKAKYGVVTDKKVKRIGCSTLKELVENNKLLITDEDIISEFSTFIERKGSYSADEGYHDDLVMTLVLFAWATTCQYFKELNDSSKRELLYRDMINRAEEELTPFGFILDGTEEEQKIVNF